MTIDVKQIETLIRAIDQYKIPGQGTTRLPLSSEEMQARAFLVKKMKELGLTVEVDSVGNIFATCKGEDASLAPIWVGSHIDTVIEAGMFDGVAGVVAGMESIRSIQENHIEHKRDICLCVYMGEESTRFSIGCLGTRTMAGEIKRDDLSSIRDLEGNSLEALLTESGFQLESFEQIKKKSGDVYASLELHIEQSPNLERNRKTIGIVKAICAPTNLMLTIEGEQSHAGGTSMTERIDAFMAASEISLGVEEIAKDGASDYTTGTVGHVEVMPNAVNVIPGKVIMSIDVRDMDYQSKEDVVKRIINHICEIEKKRHVKIQIEEKANDIPATCDAHIMKILEDICIEKDISYMHVLSGAYHDSMFIGQFAPIGMIFVPSKNGISHSPLEWTDFEDIARGTELLTQAITVLANEVS